MRMLYASHHMKRRDSVLPIISDKLLRLEKTEREILTELTEKMKKETHFILLKSRKST